MISNLFSSNGRLLGGGGGGSFGNPKAEAYSICKTQSHQIWIYSHEMEKLGRRNTLVEHFGTSESSLAPLDNGLLRPFEATVGSFPFSFELVPAFDELVSCVVDLLASLFGAVLVV